MWPLQLAHEAQRGWATCQGSQHRGSRTGTLVPGPGPTTALHFINTRQLLLLSWVGERPQAWPKDPAPSPAPRCCLGNSSCSKCGAGRQVAAWRRFHWEPRAPSLPPAQPAQEAWRRPERWAHGLATGLPSPVGARRPRLPSWASSAGINTIKGMFSLLLGFTMCRERKNKLFVPTWAIGWRQNFLRKARKLPSAFQERRWAEARGPGTRESEGPSPGLVGEAQEGQGIQGTESRLESGEVTLHPSPALDPRDTPGRLWSLAKRRLCPLGEAAWCRGSRRDTSPLTPLPCV